MANFHLGSAQLNEIAAKAKLQRSTAYLVAEQLVAKELVRQDLRAYKKQFIATEPSHLLHLLDREHRSVGKLTIKLKDNLTELEQSYKSTSSAPRVSTHHGERGLITVLEDILKTKGEILLWTNQQSERRFFSEKLHQQFISQRVKKQIPTRVLAVSNTEGQQLLYADESQLRRTRLLPEDASFSAETYLYDDKIAILDFSNGVLATVIDSSSVSASQKTMFEIAWSAAA